MKPRSIYDSAGESYRSIIRRVLFILCLVVAALMALVTGFNIETRYFAFDFYTVIALGVLSIAASLFVRSGHVTAGALFLIAAMEAIVVSDPYPLLGEPAQLALFLAGDFIGFIVTILLGALFVGRLAVVILTAVAAANVTAVALLSHEGPLEASTPIYVIGLLVAGALVFLLNALFQSALSSARSEERRAAALREQLLHSQKLEAIGRFAGSIAHDFNNMLAVISGRIEIVRIRAGVPGEVLSHAEEIMQVTGKAAELVRQLLLFSRKRTQEGSTFDARSAIAGIESMMKSLVRRGVALEMEQGEAPLPVHLNPGQFEQVIMNLVVNARDATPDGGRITVRSSLVDSAEPLLEAQPPLGPGRYVGISVRDTGTGIDEEVKSHLFEPFFTTKPEGTGTGLGLSTVYAIVSQAGGGITVESSPGSGAEFVVYLPAAAV